MDTIGKIISNRKTTLNHRGVYFLDKERLETKTI